MVAVTMSSLNSKLKCRHQNSRRWYVLAAAGLAFVLLVTLALRPSERKELEMENLENAVGSVSAKGSEQKSSVDILMEEADGIAYYHCTGNGRGDEVSLVLLHGARFTKEDWKTSEIVEDLCKRETQQKRLKVFAVDLTVQADYKELMKFLDTLATSGHITKPVSLVTPSASGKTMVTWAASTTVQETLPRYIKQWIPVAALAVNKSPEDDIRKLSGLSILAVHGDLDKEGKQSSERLKSLAGARTLELVGGHPCYLDSPKEFVNELTAFLEQSG